MGNIIAALAGAPSAANTAGSYYQNALNQLYNQYAPSATGEFSGEEIAALQPGFKQQQQNLLGELNATGIANSGAAKADLSNLAAGQSSAEAGAIAPLFQQGLGEAGSILTQEPGAQNAAYQNAIQQLYQAIQMGGDIAAGIPPSSGGSGGGGGQSYSSSDPYSSVAGGYVP